LGKRAKTDPIEAMVIAHFAEAAKPEIRPLPDDAPQLLAGLVARRRQIIQMMVAERQRQRRLVEKRLQKSIARLLKALEKEPSLDQSIDDAVRGSPAWREKEDLLASVPGVGLVIARTLIAELRPPFVRDTSTDGTPAIGRSTGLMVMLTMWPDPCLSISLAARWVTWKKPARLINNAAAKSASEYSVKGLARRSPHCSPACRCGRNAPTLPRSIATRDPPARPSIPKQAKSPQIPESGIRPGCETLTISAGAGGAARRALRKRSKLAWFYSAPLAGFCFGVDRY
jgi:hypothetical protein